MSFNRTFRWIIFLLKKIQWCFLFLLTTDLCESLFCTRKLEQRCDASSNRTTSIDFKNDVDDTQIWIKCREKRIKTREEVQLTAAVAADIDWAVQRTVHMWIRLVSVLFHLSLYPPLWSLLNMMESILATRKRNSFNQCERQTKIFFPNERTAEFRSVPKTRWTVNDDPEVDWKKDEKQKLVQKKKKLDEARRVTFWKTCCSDWESSRAFPPKIICWSLTIWIKTRKNENEILFLDPMTNGFSRVFNVDFSF